MVKLLTPEDLKSGNNICYCTDLSEVIDDIENGLDIFELLDRGYGCITRIDYIISSFDGTRFESDEDIYTYAIPIKSINI